MDLPNRASDAGPEPVAHVTRTPEELVMLAEEYLHLYRATKRSAMHNTPKSAWRVHLSKAMDLLNEAEDLEIDA